MKTLFENPFVLFVAFVVKLILVSGRRPRSILCSLSGEHLPMRRFAPLCAKACKRRGNIRLAG